MRSPALAFVLGTIAIAVGLPTASAAAQAFPANPQKLLPTAHFEGTNGYEVTVSAGRDSLLLTASTSGDTHYLTKPGNTVTYLVTTERTHRRRLVGTFGDAGSIRMGFQGRGRPRDHRLQGCDGTYTLRRGRWHGLMRFAGTAGFTSVVATEAPGRILTRSSLDCDSEGEDEGQGPSQTRHGLFLDVLNRQARRGAGTALMVSWLQGGRAVVRAGVSETDGRVTVSHETVAKAAREDVHINPRRGRARVEPGGPFFGSGKYKASDHDVDIREGIPVEPGPTWEGDLGVVLPGLGAVPLTGPEFEPTAGALTVTTLKRRTLPFGSVQAPLAPLAAN